MILCLMVYILRGGEKTECLHCLLFVLFVIDILNFSFTLANACACVKSLIHVLSLGHVLMTETGT